MVYFVLYLLHLRPNNVSLDRENEFMTFYKKLWPNTAPKWRHYHRLNFLHLNISSEEMSWNKKMQVC